MFNQKRRSKIVNRSELLVVLSTNHIAEQLYHKHIPLDSNTTHIWLNRYLIIFNVHYRNELQWMLLIQNYFIHQVAKFFCLFITFVSSLCSAQYLICITCTLENVYIRKRTKSTLGGVNLGYINYSYDHTVLWLFWMLNVLLLSLQNISTRCVENLFKKSDLRKRMLLPSFEKSIFI